MSRSSAGEWSLSVVGQLSSDTMRGAIAALNRALAGGPTARIAAALIRLISATRRPGWMDDETAAVYADVVQEAMHDYPVDIVEEACVSWRKGPSGEWWPAEKELRRVCEKLFEPRRALRNKAMALLGDLEASEQAAARASPFVGDKVKAFINEMRNRLSPSRFNAYFHISQIGSTDREIVSRTKAGARIMRQEGGDILDRLGLRVRYDHEGFSRVHEPSHEDDTPEDRAIVSRKLDRLMRALRSGENLTALRQNGEI